MERDKEVIEMLSEVFKALGLKRLSNRIEAYLLLPDPENLEKVLEEGLGWVDFSKLLKNRSFSFGNYTIGKYYIATAESKYNDNGQPIIAINELPDSDKAFKDNPITNLFITYKDEDERDRDYERVRMVMK